MYPAKQSGFTYLAMLFAIAFAGLLLVKAGIDWTHARQRDKEQELLFVGGQFRQAIAQYYQRTPGMLKRYPSKLDDLLSDTRFYPPQHYLRQIYRDPITNQKEWGLVISSEGGISGVYSKSDLAPIKIAEFRYVDQAFEGASKYSSWKFVYIPPSLVSTSVK
jgi:type II secretory pathway pseudopilin PulG